jgi:hypothetical protein
LSFFNLRRAAISALAGAAVLLPSLWRQFGMTFGPEGLWVLTYHPGTSAAVVFINSLDWLRYPSVIAVAPV